MTTSATMSADDRAALLALLCLKGMGPARLRWLVGDRQPSAVLVSLQKQRLPDHGPRPRGLTSDLASSWFTASRRGDPHALLQRHHAAGIGVLAPGDDVWPFADDPEPPAMVFVQGDLAALGSQRRVGVVGTRRCTSVGRRVAQSFGADLTAAGISVVSGLALGIDGAAHGGALTRIREAPIGQGSATPPPLPIAVVAGGLDHIYPPKNRGLWQQLLDQGLLVSEAPLGVAPERWRFPARNRLIAALSDLLVVVESHGSGGALLTVDEAADRDVPVVAVPGSVMSAASDGTNRLLLDGVAPVRHAGDVLDMLGFVPPIEQLALAIQGESSESEEREGVAPNPVTERDKARAVVLAEVGASAVHVDTLVAATGLGVVEVLSLVRRLATEGHVEIDGNWVGLSAEGSG
jgi:DNA processing protein